MRISVIGTGYLGATHAACLASWGHEVIGVDRDPALIGALQEGRAPFYEPGLDELLPAVRFTTSLAEVDGADVHFLCVGTPQSPDGAADLSALEESLTDLAPHLRRDALVVGKSTVPVGTAARLRERVPRLAWNPEFLREGSAMNDALHPERLVLGVADIADQLDLAQVYWPLIHAGVPVVVTDLATAELAKVAANLMLATRISQVNLLAEVCDRSGADIADLVEILALDSRIGGQVLRPGIGYGGGCLPKDSLAFAHRSAELGVPHGAELVEVVDAINRRQRIRVIELLESMLDGSVDGRPVRVAALGLSFKGGTDDVRDSPALEVAERLARRGCEVVAYDPRAGEHVSADHPELHVADGVEQACAGADAVLLLTDWEEFGHLDPAALREVVGSPRLIDGRHLADPGKWRAAGWDVVTPGRPA